MGSPEYRHCESNREGYFLFVVYTQKYLVIHMFESVLNLTCIGMIRYVYVNTCINKYIHILYTIYMRIFFKMSCKHI